MTVKDYLLSLDQEKRNIVMIHVVEKHYGLNAISLLDTDCTKPIPKDSPTVNGEWECIGGEWTWIPAI